MSEACEQGLCQEMLDLREKVAALTTDVRVLQRTRALAWQWGAGIVSALVFALAIADFVWRMLRAV